MTEIVFKKHINTLKKNPLLWTNEINKIEENLAYKNNNQSPNNANTNLTVAPHLRFPYSSQNFINPTQIMSLGSKIFFNKNN